MADRQDLRQDLGAEEWRAVGGFEGAYEVSSLGRVRALPRMIGTKGGAVKAHLGGIMTAVIDRDGYPRVVLRVDGKHYTRRVHRLVAAAFHSEGQNALHREVDHIDHDKSNACSANLRWVSRAENMHFRRPFKRLSSSHSRLTPEQVRQIRGARGRQATNTVAAEHGISPYTVTDIWRRKRWADLP